MHSFKSIKSMHKSVAKSSLASTFVIMSNNVASYVASYVATCIDVAYMYYCLACPKITELNGKLCHLFGIFTVY